MDRFPLTKFQKGMETAAWVVSAATLWKTLLRWRGLPETVAIHFNALGAADDWGERWTVFLLPAVMVICCGVVSLCARLGLKYVNLPFRVNREREWYVLRAVRDTLVLLNLELTVTMSVMQLHILFGHNLPVWFTWTMGGVLLATCAFGLWRSWTCNQGTL